MAQYQIDVKTYTLMIYTPNHPDPPWNFKSVIGIQGDAGLAILYFVPQNGQLGQNQKRPKQNIFDIYFWMDSWPHFTDLLRNEKPVVFLYDDSDNTALIRSLMEPLGEAEIEKLLPTKGLRG